MFHGVQSSALLFSPQMSVAGKLRRLVLPLMEPMGWMSTESHPFQLSTGTDILDPPSPDRIQANTE